MCSIKQIIFVWVNVCRHSNELIQSWVFEADVRNRILLSAFRVAKTTEHKFFLFKAEEAYARGWIKEKLMEEFLCTLSLVSLLILPFVVHILLTYLCPWSYEYPLVLINICKVLKLDLRLAAASAFIAVRLKRNHIPVILSIKYTAVLCSSNEQVVLGDEWVGGALCIRTCQRSRKI